MAVNSRTGERLVRMTYDLGDLASRMTEIKRQKVIEWADAADVSVETAEKLLTLAGLTVKPEVDPITKFVRILGAVANPPTRSAWEQGRMDCTVTAEGFRKIIDRIREYERERIIGDQAALMASWLNPNSTITLALRGILSRLAGAE